MPEAPMGFDVRVKVEAVSVNPVDWKVRVGAFDDPTRTFGPPKIIGFDAAGVVEAAGPDALFKVGDTVYYAGDLTRPGTNQQFHLVDSRIVGAMPLTLDFAAAAALSLTTLTAWESLFDRLRISRTNNAGKCLLIINGAGGVGSITIQLAKKLAPGLRVVATAGKPESVAWCKGLGADDVISHRAPLGPQLAALGLPTVDYIYFTHSTTEYWDQACDLIAPQGSMNTIVLLPGAGSLLNMMPLYMKSVTFSTEAMFTRGMFKTADIAQQHALLTEVGRMIDSGSLKVTTREGSNFGVVNAANLARAHAELEKGTTIGKLVLSGW
jgi:NADPH2:quinone reductase